MSTLKVNNLQTTVANTVSAFKDVNGTEIGRLCRAWVNFNGTGTVAIRSSFNVSSITDDGVGLYTVNFTTSLPSANYATLVSAGPQSSLAFNYAVGNPETATPTVSSVQVTAERSDGAAADLSNFSVAVFS